MAIFNFEKKDGLQRGTVGDECMHCRRNRDIENYEPKYLDGETVYSTTSDIELDKGTYNEQSVYALFESKSISSKAYNFAVIKTINGIATENTNIVLTAEYFLSGGNTASDIEYNTIKIVTYSDVIHQNNTRVYPKVDLGARYLVNGKTEMSGGEIDRDGIDIGIPGCYKSVITELTKL